MNIAHSLIQLYKFRDAKDCLMNKSEILLEESDYWWLLAILYKKEFNYAQATESLKESLRLNPKNEKTLKEKVLIDHLSQMENKVEYKLDKFKNLNLSYTDHSNKKSSYKILSIDGGGVRGVIAAFMLCEIERETNKPISRIFDLISGTSTGGIIAAGLVKPNIRDKLKPEYTAYDILDLYLTNAKKIFCKPTETPLYEYVIPKYTDEGRYSLFEKYFENKTLNESLCELVIPAVNKNILNLPQVFNSFDAKNNNLMNLKIVDILMATSAAPSYFHAYEIKGRGVFIDGGVHANNPSQIAYINAINNGVPKENIYLVSIGTGDYMNSLYNTYTDGLLYWAKNLKHVAFIGQVRIIDQSMYLLLGDKYQRLQPWFDRQIDLDDNTEENFLIEIANQFVEEYRYSGDFQKLINALIE